METVDLSQCVKRPGEMDWADQPEDVLMAAAANGIPGALAELVRQS